jgi:hypothetical protein
MPITGTFVAASKVAVPPRISTIGASVPAARAPVVVENSPLIEMLLPLPRDYYRRGSPRYVTQEAYSVRRLNKLAKNIRHDLFLNEKPRNVGFTDLNISEEEKFSVPA